MANLEKPIPVIGVPPEPPKPPAAAAKIEETEEEKALSKAMKKAKKKMEKGELKTTTGEPAANNGIIVERLQNALTVAEQKIYHNHIVTNCEKNPKFRNKTKNGQKKHKFKIRLIWLLNKDHFMSKVAKKGDKPKKKGPQPANITPKKQEKSGDGKPAEKKNQPKNPPKTVPKNPKNPPKNAPKQPIRPLMDVPVIHLNLCQNPPYPSNSTGGYQYLDEQWLTNTMHPPPTTTWPTMNPAQMDPYGSTYPSSSSYPPSSNFSAYQAPISYQPMLPDLISQAVGAPVQNSYYQEPAAEPVVPEQPSAYQLAFGVGSAPAPPTPTVPISSSSSCGAAEEELARQKRLMEIEEELNMINTRRIQMAMEAEIRQREQELAERQQWVEIRERQVRHRESYESGRRSAERDRWEHDRHRRDSPPRRHHPSTSSSSRATYLPREISIEERDRLRAERDADAARRHGQRRDETEQVLSRRERRAAQKRSYLEGRASRIQEAKKVRSYVDIPKEDISDDEF